MKKAALLVRLLLEKGLRPQEYCQENKKPGDEPGFYHLITKTIV
jgi:hypothetical protein